MASWKKLVTSGSSPVFNNTSICGTLALGDFTDVSASLAAKSEGSILYEAGSGAGSIQPNINSNDASGACANIGGGKSNTALGNYGVIGGGLLNIVSGSNSTIGGGQCHIITGSSNTIAGGRENHIRGSITSNATVAGGFCNKVCARQSTIGGGFCNDIQDDGTLSVTSATIGGGVSNTICSYGLGSTIGGGQENIITKNYSFIGGGVRNFINNSCGAVIVGGCYNTASGNFDSIVGGCENNLANASNLFKFIGGGCQNYNSGGCSAILGGKQNCLTHANSFIIGSNLTSSAACTTFVNSLNISGSLAIPGFSNVSASLASLGGTSITRANLTFSSSNSVTNEPYFSYQVSTDPNLNCWLVTGSRAAILNTSRIYPNIISGSHGAYAAEVIVNGISNVIRQTGDEGSTTTNTSVAILNGSNNLISSSVGSSILAGTNNKIHNGRYSIIGGGNSNCLIGDFYSGGSCVLIGNSIVGGQHNRISGSSNAGNTNWWNTIGGGEYNRLYQTGCSIIGAGHYNRVLGNSATFANSNKTYKENSIVAGRCNDIIDERNSHIIGGACNKIIGDSTQNTVTQGSGNIIGAGHCNVITGSCCSAILGGKENCLKHSESFIIGSCITSSASCTTFVNNLCVLGNLNTDGTDGNVVYERGTGTDSVKPVDSSNSSSGTCSTVLGGCNNNVETYISAIVSGCGNSIVGNNITNNNYYNAILNGRCNQISSSVYATILGGQCNSASYIGGSLISGDRNKIIDATGGSASYRACAISILGGNDNDVHNWYTGTNISVACRAYNIGLFNSISSTISGSRGISMLGGSGHDVFTTASNGSHSSTVCNTNFVGGIGNRAGSNTINSIVSYVNFIGGTTNCAYRGDGEIIGGKNNCFLNSGSAFSLAITIGGCHNTQTNSTGASERDNNIIVGGRYNSIDGALCSNILGGSSNSLKLTKNSHILGNTQNSTITGSSATSPNTSGNNTIVGGYNVNLYNTSGIIAIGVHNRTIQNCHISSGTKVFIDTAEIKNLCTTSEIESPIGKFEKLRGASPITSEDTINITASFDSGAFTHPALILSGSEAIQATGSVDISGSLSITGFTNVSSSLAAASSIPTLQQVTDAGASTTTAVTLSNLTVTGTASFQHTTDLDVADRFIKLASGSNADGVGGIAIQQTSATDAQAFGWDNATGRWGITSSFNASQNTFTPSAYMGTVINGTDDDPNNLDSSLHKAGNIYIDTDKSTDGIWLYG